MTCPTWKMAEGLERLPLVDVNTDTAAQTWPLLQRAIEHADFIALDLELSGLGHSKTRKVAPDLEEKYKAMREVAASHGILSVGVACFKWEQQDAAPKEEEEGGGSGGSCGCRVEVFNIWLLSNEPYTIDPSSAKFLIQHGFDFNKHFAQGIRYSPATTELSSEEPSMKMLFLRLLCSSKPVVVHNGWVDLLFLYQSFYSPLPSCLGSFMADLSEMITGGIYDTKAIAQYKGVEHATFLEYIFRKRQSVNIVDQSESRSHLKLCYASYDAAVSCVDHVTVAPPTPPPLEQLLKIQMCHTFERYGYCNKPSCEKCHQVSIAVAQEEHYAALKAASNKRKREHRQQRKMLKKAKLDAAPDSSSVGEQLEDTSIADAGTSPSDDTQLDAKEPASPHTTLSSPSLAETFQRELATAKAKLTEGDTSRGSRCKPSFGHRAGFDAFMTGYAFACYCVMTHSETAERETEKESGMDKATTDPTSSKQADEEEDNNGCSRAAGDEWWLAGLGGMKNRLGNRSKSVPMVVAKSHFAKTSEGHRAAQRRLGAWLHAKQSQDT